MQDNIAAKRKQSRNLSFGTYLARILVSIVRVVSTDLSRPLPWLEINKAAVTLRWLCQSIGGAKSMSAKGPN